MKPALFIGLAVFATGYVAVWVRALSRARRGESEGPRPGGLDHPVLPTPAQTAIGFVTNFFDTLGIGSFAPTASVYKLTRRVPDALIPGTMNVGHTLPVVVMAYIYITIVDVDPRTLAILIGSSRLVQKQAYSLRPALGLTLGGIPAVLIAAFIVKSLDLDTLRWLVVIVAAYTAVMMLRSAARGDQSDAPLAVELPVEESK